MAAKKKRKMQSASLVCAVESMAALREDPSCASALHNVHKSLLDGGQAAESFAADLVAHGFLELIPDILRHSSRKGVATGVKVLGVFSMSSLTTHRKVVSCGDAMCAFTEIFGSTDVDLLTSACHAAVDLLITPFACATLRESGVLQCLLRLLCWTADCAKEAETSLVAEGHQSSSRSTCEPLAEGCGESPSSEVLLASEVPINAETSSCESEIVTTALQDTTFCGGVDELVTAAVTAISALLRYHGVEGIPKDLLGNALSTLRRHWHTLLKQDGILLKSTAADEEPRWTWNRRTRHVVAKCVVQLAMEFENDASRNLSVEQGLFENTHISLEYFLEKYWEQSPVLLSRQIPSCLLASSQKFSNLATVVNDFLAWSVTCPPACADQVDSLRLFEALEGTLGEPMIYGRDIRIVKTILREHEKLSTLNQGLEPEDEIHFCPQSFTSEQQFARHVHSQGVLEAVGRGYTVAIKGMELRCPDIANVAGCLARQCGQPSVGVNLYLTPPDAQGLELHFDDHCVFVCQLVGRKTWTVFTPQRLLPKLYASRVLNLEALDSTPPTLFNLEEGEVLYIPRGFPHKAHSGHPAEEISEAHLPCSLDFPLSGAAVLSLGQWSSSASGEPVHGVEDTQRYEDDATKEQLGGFRFGAGEHRNMLDKFSNGLYSLHLTFGIEVELPFTWEGLVHVALRLWTEQRWQTQTPDHRASVEESDHRTEQLCEALLHIAINILGEKEIVLRKACMVGASTTVPKHPRSEAWHKTVMPSEYILLHSKCGSSDSLDCESCDGGSVDYFQALVELVVQKADYHDAYSFAQGVSDNCTSFYTGGMEWLRYVGGKHGPFLEPVSLVENMMQLNNRKEFSILGIEATFATMRTEFGTALMFHDASNAIGTVWSKFSTVRKKFMRGMLALHDNLV